MEKDRPQDRLTREAAIRAAVVDYAILSQSHDRLTEQETIDDINETIFRWTGLHPSSLRGGPAIVFDEALKVQQRAADH